MQRTRPWTHPVAGQRARDLLLLTCPLVALACGTGAMSQTRLMDSSGEGDRSATGVQGPIAVGASIAPTIDVTVPGSGAPAIELESTRPQVLAIDGQRLVGQAPGVAAVLITTSSMPR